MTARVSLGLPWIISAPPLPPTGWAALGALGVIQLGVSYWLYARAIRHVTALEAVLIPVIEPILNPVWVLIFMHEKPDCKSNWKSDLGQDLKHFFDQKVYEVLLEQEFTNKTKKDEIKALSNEDSAGSGGHTEKEGFHTNSPFYEFIYGGMPSSSPQMTQKDSESKKTEDEIIK